nr:hypothetical protein [Nocardia bovistercoris]
MGEVRPEHDNQPTPTHVSLHYQRSYRQPILDVWSACTDRTQLTRWLGKITGAHGNLSIDLLDGPTTAPIAIRVDHCAAPQELVLHIDGSLLEMRLSRIGVVTTIELVRRHLTPAKATTIGPRWQYLLDRLDAYLDYRDLPRWSDYPELAAEYR